MYLSIFRSFKNVGVKNDNEKILKHHITEIINKIKGII